MLMSPSFAFRRFWQAMSDTRRAATNTSSGTHNGGRSRVVVVIEENPIVLRQDLPLDLTAYPWLHRTNPHPLPGR